MNVVPLELIAKFGLVFSQPITYAVVVLIGFFTLSEKIFGRTIFVLLFTVLYNVYLKNIWQIPLPPPAESGWAFPSGHTHCAFVFWGWLACEYRRVWFSVLMGALILLVGYGLVYQGYHYPSDILAAGAFGTVTLGLYSLLNRLRFFSEQPYRLGVLMSGLCTFLFFLLLPPETRKLHVWQAYGALLGFTLGLYLLQKQGSFKFTQLKEKSIAILLALGGVYIINLTTNSLPLSPKEIIGIKFFFMTLWVSTCKIVVVKLMKTPSLKYATLSLN